MPGLSIIIRTLNEQKWLSQVLSAIQKQDISDYEVIVVDSGSTDRTQAIALEFGCRIVTISKDSFNYSFASNIGASHAKGEILAFLSGHSVLALPSALRKALNHFADATVAGVYGEVLPLPDASIWEKAFHCLGYLKNYKKAPQIINRLKPGVLSCTNALIRKDLWEEHPFEDRFGQGGEDLAWAAFWLQKDYRIILEPEFLVYHSHGSGLSRFRHEILAWQQMYNDVCINMGINPRMGGQR